MSLTLAGAAIGFLSSAVPEVLNFFQEKENKKISIKELELKKELLQTNADIDLTKFRAKAQDEEHARLIEHDNNIGADTGFFGGLRKSVRPVVTYSFFGLFAYIKIVLLQEVLTVQESAEMIAALEQVWDEETRAIFAAVMSFWFGDRAITKYREFRYSNQRG